MNDFPTSVEQLKALLGEKYVSVDGDEEEEYSFELLPPLSDDEIDQLRQQCPAKHLPDDIVELLRFARGFKFSWLDDFSFTEINAFAFEEVYPFSVQLTSDGLGNFWIIDIDQHGRWGKVFYVCHDPAVSVLQAENLVDFLRQLDEYGKKGDDSTLGAVYNKRIYEIDKSQTGIMPVEDARAAADPVLVAFAQTLPDHYVVADLRNKPVQSGFAWGRFLNSRDSIVVRHPDELLWGFEQTVKKKGFFARLFGS